MMKNLKISLQLKLGIMAMLLFVIFLGGVSYWQSNQIFMATQTMYNHPLPVRNALGNLTEDILKMDLAMKDLLMLENDSEIQKTTRILELSASDAQKQFNVLYDRFLGSLTDIDAASNAFIIWKISINENLKLVQESKKKNILQNISSKGDLVRERDQLMAKINVIDDFAANKANALYTSALDLKNSFNNQLILLVALLLALSFTVNYILLRNIRKPIDELTSATKQFHSGNKSARSRYISKNEFGGLSLAFNKMIEDIQLNSELDEMVNSLSGLMLSEYDANKFFKQTLSELSSLTNSQMAAIYLLSNDKKTFEHFESIGMDNNATKSFDALNHEGEFGTAIAAHKIQHHKNIPDDTRFTFNTVTGKIIPREIITLPILSEDEVVAIISLASINFYSINSILLINRILDTLSARVQGILGYRRMKEFSLKLEDQNRKLEAQKTELEVQKMELEAQKTELATQSSELTKQNTELEMQKKQLHEVSRLKTSFLSNMSHELRTPLNSVIALSGVLNRRLNNKIPAEEYSYLEVIERNGKHLLSLINDILDISRIEAGREDLEITNFNVSNLIKDVTEMILPQVQQKNIELLYSEGVKHLSIESDFAKCRHILQNLVGNAVKFTEKGSVEISALKSGNKVIITVTDTGIGISENHLPHIFDEFRQADGSTSRRFGGTGLGLAIAKKYANLLGGSISVVSTPGSGSSFMLSIPTIYPSENKTLVSNETSYSKYDLKPVTDQPSNDLTAKTILLVEDSEPAIIQMKDILDEKGYHLLVANNGSEALEIISKTIPDAMILDLMMPGIDGFEVLKTIRDAEPTAHIPVLILTAKHITKEELQFLKRNNIHQLIQKGDVNRDEFLNSVFSMVHPKTTEEVKTQRTLETVEGKPVLLIVEDNPDNMITVKALLADNYTVLESVDGISGIEMAKKFRPDLILMDIALPGIDGIEAFKRIRKDPELLHIPVIALTASAMNSDRETILAHGLDGYIAKPIDEKTFFKTINSVLYGT